jgi:uncharacterized protein YdhG (YjbR/CyaY superfamily)
MAAKKISPEVCKAEVEAYLARVPEPARNLLDELRATIRAAAPKTATEEITYRIPSFNYKGSLVAYAAFKRHCSFFPMGSRVLEDFAEELKDFRTSRGTIQLPLDKPLPKALITRLVKACVARNEARTQSSSR